MEVDINTFLGNYSDEVQEHAHALRMIIKQALPNIHEQLDLPAKMIAYTYGSKYKDLICTIIPSQKGIKLGFNRGTQLENPNKLLEGNGKISRYVPIKSITQISAPEIHQLITEADKCYQQL